MGFAEYRSSIKWIIIEYTSKATGISRLNTSFHIATGPNCSLQYDEVQMYTNNDHRAACRYCCCQFFVCTNFHGFNFCGDAGPRKLVPNENFCIDGNLSRGSKTVLCNKLSNTLKSDEGAYVTSKSTYSVREEQEPPTALLHCIKGGGHRTCLLYIQRGRTVPAHHGAAWTHEK